MRVEKKKSSCRAQKSLKETSSQRTTEALRQNEEAWVLGCGEQ